MIMVVVDAKLLWLRAGAVCVNGARAMKMHARDKCASERAENLRRPEFFCESALVA